jgi:transposase
LYGVRVEIEAYGYDCYGYLFCDEERRFNEKSVLDKKDDESKEKDKLSKADYTKKVETLGLFALFSTELLEISDALPTYYGRNIVEQTFDVLKTNSKAVPLGAKSETTYRGQLLVTFISSIWYLAIGEKVKHEKKYGIVEALDTLLEMKCKVFENKVTILPPTAQQTEVAKIFKVDLPVEIPLPIDSNKAYTSQETTAKKKKTKIELHVKD